MQYYKIFANSARRERVFKEKKVKNPHSKQNTLDGDLFFYSLIHSLISPGTQSRYLLLLPSR